MVSNSSDEFLGLLLNGVLKGAHQYVSHSVDPERFGLNTAEYLSARLRDKTAQLFRKMGNWTQRHFDGNTAADRLSFIIQHLEEFTETYELLSDDFSRQMMLRILQFRILGGKHIHIPLNTPEYWAERRRILNYRQRKGTRQVQKFSLDRYQFPSDSVILNTHLQMLNILNTFVLEQYAYCRSHPPVVVEPGDIVLDLGACWGDTSLYFAIRGGADSRVLAFEFDEPNLQIFQENMKLNEEIASRISLICKGVTKDAIGAIPYDSKGPGTRLSAKEATGKDHVETTNIDTIVEAERLQKVDFIKMDIEGSELAALRGGEQTLLRNRPKLAISVYHKPEDLITIPQYLDSLDLGYRFYLDHFTIHNEETVLFATEDK